MPTRLIVSATGSVPAQACRAVRPSTHSAEASMVLPFTSAARLRQAVIMPGSVSV